mmetsp:Transcript_36109/g.47467  ORF Transcript_36109/g.47467 Transcript_36109/m.47467 type:complete len:82 (-) Transcript_36109:1930-2175(-)
MLIDRNDLALGAQLHLGRVIVSEGYAATVALELSADNYDLFADKLVSHESILAGNTLACARLHELSSQNLRVATVLHEDAI